MASARKIIMRREEAVWRRACNMTPMHRGRTTIRLSMPMEATRRQARLPSSAKFSPVCFTDEKFVSILLKVNNKSLIKRNSLLLVKN